MAVVDAPDAGRWWVVVPLKDTRLGKSRIRVDASTRQALALAMARDTLAVALATPEVARVVLVCEHPADAQALAHPRLLAHLDRARAGLNPAIAAGAALARALAPDCHLAVLPADLPTLTSIELSLALRLAGHHARAFVADHDGTGTTLLTARAGHDLDPHYGPGSRARHARTGARALTDPGLTSLRDDIDDLATLTTLAGTVAPNQRAQHRSTKPSWRVIAAQAVAADGRRDLIVRGAMSAVEITP